MTLAATRATAAAAKTIGRRTRDDLIRARLLPALVSRWGAETGRDLCSEVEEYAWEHRHRLSTLDNPLGYLYRVAQSRSRRYVRWRDRTTFPSRVPEVVHEDLALHDTLQLLATLSADQRVCVLLVHGFGWTYVEVAELLGVTRSAVNNHVHRGLAQLRRNPMHDPLLSPPTDSRTPQEDLR